MEGRVAKVLLGLLQGAADPALFDYVIIKLFHVALSLFGALAFGLSARTFGFGAFALRYVVRASSPEIVAEHWAGDPATLRRILWLARA